VISSMRDPDDGPDSNSPQGTLSPVSAAPGDLRQLILWARKHFGVGAAAAVTCGAPNGGDFVALAGSVENELPCRQALCLAALRRRRPFLHTREKTAAEDCPHGAERCPHFCAGVPITSGQGELLGGVYVFDSKPHRFGVVDMEVLKGVAELVRRAMSVDAVAS
jgi:GAF domain-containing protein